ncbi:MAG: PAS domain-containing protein [Proteobacteria bacterium]|nr:PAS domain-containing protein [Pseudomonadota bacterium]
MSSEIQKKSTSLIDEAGVTQSLQLSASTENAWIEVIHKMDSVYADLVHYQVELEQKNTALEEAQKFIDSVLSAMTDVLIVCDTEGRVVQVNEALESLTGKKAAAFLNCSLGEVFTSDSSEMVDQFPEKLGQESLVDCEVSVLCVDGSSAPLAMNCSSRYDHDGGLVGMVLIGRPTGELRRAYDELNRTHNELKQTQQQLVQSEKMAALGRLVAGVAHELNNPISFVLGNMHALRRNGSRVAEYLSRMRSITEGMDDAHKLREEFKIDHIVRDMDPLIDGTLEGAVRVSDIVQDLRRYSGSQKEESIRFDLISTVKKAVQWVVNASREKPEVQYDCPEHIEIFARRGQVHQILVNLIQNAIDAMANQSRPCLTISCEKTPEGVKTRVMDEGPGIPESALAHIFDPFYTSKPVGQGTGLGLYISYGLANDVGGNLEAGNARSGGAIMTLTLPAGDS